MWLTRQERDGDGGIGGRCLHTIGPILFLFLLLTLVAADAGGSTFSVFCSS